MKDVSIKFVVPDGSAYLTGYGNTSNYLLTLTVYGEKRLQVQTFASANSKIPASDRLFEITLVRGEDLRVPWIWDIVTYPSKYGAEYVLEQTIARLRIVFSGEVLNLAPFVNSLQSFKIATFTKSGEDTPVAVLCGETKYFNFSLSLYNNSHFDKVSNVLRVWKKAGLLVYCSLRTSDAPLTLFSIKIWKNGDVSVPNLIRDLANATGTVAANI